MTCDSGLLNLLPESPDPFEASITFSLPPPAFKPAFLKLLASICSLNKTAAVATLPFQMLLTTNYSPRVLARISPLFYLAPRTHLLNSKKLFNCLFFFFPPQENSYNSTVFLSPVRLTGPRNKETGKKKMYQAKF